MKTKIVLLAALLFSLILNAQNNSSEIIKSDPSLSMVNSALPKGWVMNIENNKMVVERKDSILSFKTYRFNSPLIKMTKPEREEYIKKEGRSCKSRIVYRIEPIWDANKIIEANNNNETLYAKLKQLPEKHKLSELKKMGGRNSEAVYQPRNENDKKNIKAYEDEKKELESKIIKLPNFSTKNYSVFFISREGYDDDYHFVYPEQTSIELFTIENLFRELCGK